MQHLENVVNILRQALPSYDTKNWQEDTPLLGVIPEFDSMTVLTVITLIEEEFGIYANDEDISADDFETVGSLTRWISNAL